MNDVDFSTKPSLESLTHEITCLKATLAFILKSMGQADASKAIINLQKLTEQLEDPAQIEVFNHTLRQIIHVYRQ